MQTFTVTLSDAAWTEILQGGSLVAFDVIPATAVEVLFTETAATPDASTKGNPVQTWPSGWDFEATGLNGGVQRVWAKGKGDIRGVRE
jgi:hypothetical protein